MRLFELFEAKVDKKKVPASKPQNFTAKHAGINRNAAGPQGNREYDTAKGRIRKEKHKNAGMVGEDTDIQRDISDFL